MAYCIHLEAGAWCSYQADKEIIATSYGNEGKRYALIRFRRDYQTDALHKAPVKINFSFSGSSIVQDKHFIYERNIGRNGGYTTIGEGWSYEDARIDFPYWFLYDQTLKISFTSESDYFCGTGSVSNFLTINLKGALSNPCANPCVPTIGCDPEYTPTQPDPEHGMPWPIDYKEPFPSIDPGPWPPIAVDLNTLQPVSYHFPGDPGPNPGPTPPPGPSPTPPPDPTPGPDPDPCPCPDPIPPTPFPPHIPGMDCDNHFWDPYFFVVKTPAKPKIV